MCKPKKSIFQFSIKTYCRQLSSENYGNPLHIFLPGVPALKVFFFLDGLVSFFNLTMYET